jgi:hypothetical protein
MYRLTRMGLGLMLLGVSAQAQQHTDLEGAYHRVSLTNVQTGESPEAANRRGLLILGHGHYSMMTIQPERRKLERGQKLEEMDKDAQIEFLQEWLDINAHSGRYEVEGDTLVWHRDLSEDPREVGTTSRLKYEVRDDLLVIKFGLSSGAQYEWVWKKVR